MNYIRVGLLLETGNIGEHMGLHIVQKVTLTTRYRDDIPRTDAVFYIEINGDSFFSSHAKAKPHTARLGKNILKVETIRRLEETTCSPGLNPNDHVWETLFYYL